MPGYELIGKQENKELSNIFKNSNGVLFGHAFDELRNNIFRVRDFEKKICKKLKVKYCVATTSGTMAQYVAMKALGIKENDEVITQSFTFVATVEAIIESRAIPVITEINKTLNMDPKDLEKKINKKTKAIIVVHMLGVPANLKEIKAIAIKYGIPLIEDTAWGCGGYYDNTPLGTYGDIGTFSFDFAKTMTTGEGGMLVFKDEGLFKKAAAWHDHGHENNPNLPRWEDSRSSSGFNYRMNELQGAVGIAQLKKLDKVVSIQRKNAKKIKKAISGLPIKFREIPPESYETSDALIFFVDTSDLAIKCRNSLIEEGFGTKILPEAISWHFAGLWSHMKELYEKNGRDLENSFINSKALLNRSVALPISINMKEGFDEKIKLSLDRVFNK